MKQHTYYVKGMHCASCEIIIEKKLLEMDGIKSADASTGKGQIVVMCEGQAPSPDRLSHLFKGDGYAFSNEPEKEAKKEYDITLPLIIIVFGTIGYFVLRSFGIIQGLAGLANVTASSSLPSFFVFGLLAGVSSCAALVGGIVLSMSKEWSAVYNQENSFYKKLQPHILFNAGRILSYGFFGALLGSLGAKIRLSVGFSSLLVIVIGIIMLVFGLQMLGVKAFQKFQISMPKFITRRIADPKKFNGKHVPFLLGAGTFFLPCGFTITAQGMALLSGNALQGSLIMGMFALGTLPMLFGIGIASAKLFNKPHLSATFQKIAGIILIIFSLYNINAQMTVLNMPNWNSLWTSSTTSDKTLPQIIDGKQVVKMNASARGYSPNYIKVRAGIPVRWEIKDTGTSRCTNAVIARELFSGQIDLVRGETSIKEFTPPAPGKYRFSCWMGMISGTIEVVDPDQAATLPLAAPSLVQAGTAKGGSACGSGGGCGCGGGARPDLGNVENNLKNAPAPNVISNEQIVKTVYKSKQISPNAFVVQKGKPVRFEISAQENGSGCMSTIMVPGLYNSPQLLTAGQNIEMNFTPQEAGDYQITCAMGVPWGVLRVI